eukprot:9479417-Pyramimonas_sp.AAC.1
MRGHDIGALSAQYNEIKRRGGDEWARLVTEGRHATVAATAECAGISTGAFGMHQKQREVMKQKH